MNELYTRYASEEMAQIWETKTRVLIARGIWITVMKEQRVAPDVVAAYRSVIQEVDLDSIRAREEITGHETKAWLEEFNALAGHQAAHHGLTSSDITESVTDWQIHNSLTHIMSMLVAMGVRLGSIASMYAELPMVGRTHNLPAQVTTLGHRFAVALEEITISFNEVGHLLQWQAARGLNGAVGTAADLLRVMGGDEERVLAVNSAVGDLNEIHAIALVTGQTPPRGQTAALAGGLVSACAGPTSLATTIRLMIGAGLGSEVPPAGTTGSSAMPHKMNPRYAERVCGLLGVVKGFAGMLTNSVGGVWNEGDVSDSSLRRIALPGLFLSVDGLLRSAMIMLDRFDPNEDAINTELESNRWYLKSGVLLDTLVNWGCPREDAHALLRSYYQDNSHKGHPIYEWVTEEHIRTIINGPWDLGMARQHVDLMMSWVEHHAMRHPKAAAYEPGSML